MFVFRLLASIFGPTFFAGGHDGGAGKFARPSERSSGRASAGCERVDCGVAAGGYVALLVRVLSARAKPRPGRGGDAPGIKARLESLGERERRKIRRPRLCGCALLREHAALGTFPPKQVHKSPTALSLKDACVFHDNFPYVNKRQDLSRCKWVYT